jgi:hypothetical protein
MARFTFFVGSLLAVAPASADWVIFTDGQRSQVQAVEIAERAVHITTRNGKRWSVLRESVDVTATLAANETEPPLELVAVPEAPPVAAPPEERPPPPPPRPQQTIVVRELTPLPATNTDIIQARAPSPRQYRFAITLNGVQGADTLSFADTNRFDLFKEPAQIESVYSDPRSGGYELGAQFRIAGPLAVGATVQRFENDRSAAYTASLPHPFFFDRFRELSGAASGLTHEELAVHLDAVFTKTWGPLTIDAFGGPSWFQTKTEVLVDVLYEETFPYDEVLFQGVEGRVLESRPLGFNVGASATFRIAGFFGVDFGVRYSEARSRLFIEEGREIALDAGGLSVGVGLRFLFP